MHESPLCLLDISPFRKKSIWRKNLKIRANDSTVRAFIWQLSARFVAHKTNRLNTYFPEKRPYLCFDTAVASVFQHKPDSHAHKTAPDRGANVQLLLRGVETDYQLNSKGDFTIPSPFVGYGYFSFGVRIDRMVCGGGRKSKANQSAR